MMHTPATGRPGTGRSFDSGHQFPRQSSESAPQPRRDSGSTFNSNNNNNNNNNNTSIHHNNHAGEGRRHSGLFHSALPPDSATDDSRRSSRASSRDGYAVLWLAASLFEFNIDTTKHEAGYPYLTYQAGEVSSGLSGRRAGVSSC